MSMPMVQSSAPGTSMSTTETVYLENLSGLLTRCSRPSGSYAFEPAGFEGSIVEVPKAFANDPYVRRSIRRGILGVINTQEELNQRLEQLVLRDEPDNGPNNIMKHLEAGASELAGRFLREDLPEDAEPRRSVSANKIWGQPSRNRAIEAPKRQAVTRRGMPDATIMDKPIMASDKSVLTEREYGD